VFNSLKDTRQLFDKVGRLFKKYGIKSITMDDISRELGMSKKTLYQYVADKSELVEKVIQNEFNDFKNKVNALLSEDIDEVLQLIKFNRLILENLKTYNTVIENDLRKHYFDLYQKLKLQYIDLFRECIRSNITEGKKHGIYRNEIDIDVLTKLHVSRIEQAPYSEVYTIEEYTSPGFAREACMVHIKGLINEKGQILLNRHLQELEELNK
jgi:AcrR family transcriptional regulator